MDSNESTTASSDNAGAYTIPFLRPGNYKVTATAAGFKQYTAGQDSRWKRRKSPASISIWKSAR